MLNFHLIWCSYPSNMNDRNDCDEVVQSNVLISQPRQRMFLLTAIENILNGSFYFSLLLVLLLLLERKKYTNVLHAWSYKPAITHCKSTKIEAKQNKNIFKAWTSVFVGISSGQNMKKKHLQFDLSSMFIGNAKKATKEHSQVHLDWQKNVKESEAWKGAFKILWNAVEKWFPDAVPDAVLDF